MHFNKKFRIFLYVIFSNTSSYLSKILKGVKIDKKIKKRFLVCAKKSKIK